MEELVSIWWVWVSLGLALGIVEILAPGFIFLGFAIGALDMALIVAFIAQPGVAVSLALFAGLSLLAWIALRILFRKQRTSARIITEDIND